MVYVLLHRHVMDYCPGIHEKREFSSRCLHHLLERERGTDEAEEYHLKRDIDYPPHKCLMLHHRLVHLYPAVLLKEVEGGGETAALKLVQNLLDVRH